MSTFRKPSTPTKSRPNLKPATPTKPSGSSCSINLPSSTKVLEEINLLLHLETLKRYRDNELNLKQNVEEAIKLFEERRYKFLSLVAKYTNLVKLACTRKVLLGNELEGFPTDSASEDAKNIKEKLSSGSATDYISSPELSKFKEMLHLVEKFNNLPVKRSELVDIQQATEAIQFSIEAIEKSLEKCTTEGLDHFINTLDMQNYPKLMKENDQTKKY